MLYVAGDVAAITQVNCLCCLQDIMTMPFAGPFLQVSHLIPSKYLDIYIADVRLDFRLNLIRLLAGARWDDQKTTGSMHIKPSKHTESNVVFAYTFDNDYRVQF